MHMFDERGRSPDQRKVRETPWSLQECILKHHACLLDIVYAVNWWTAVCYHHSDSDEFHEYSLVTPFKFFMTLQKLAPPLYTPKQCLSIWQCICSNWVWSHKFNRKLVLEELLQLMLNYSDAYVSAVGEIRLLASDQLILYVLKNKVQHFSEVLL